RKSRTRAGSTKASSRSRARSRRRRSSARARLAARGRARDRGTTRHAPAAPMRLGSSGDAGSVASWRERVPSIPGVPSRRQPAQSHITLMASLDLNSPEFWNRSAVDTELRRVYDICGGCRRCLPLCPSFKVLFDRLDVDAVDGDVEKLPARDVKEVVDLCYQCKLCF